MYFVFGLQVFDFLAFRNLKKLSGYTFLAFGVGSFGFGLVLPYADKKESEVEI